MNRFKYFIVLCLVPLALTTLNQARAIPGAGAFFVDSGQNLGNEFSTDVALADVDGDGDQDAFVSNGSGD